MKSTITNMILTDGRKVELTLNFARLLKVKNFNKGLYEDFMRVLKQDKDFDIIFDSIKILYVAYLCANANDLENVISEEEFMELVPDITTINIIATELVVPKKK